MIFLKIIKERKFILISTFLFLYVGLNLFDGQRGLISYFEKQKVKERLIKEKKLLLSDLSIVEKKNDLLTNIIDLDYLEILYREKFMIGKSKETIYKN